MALAFNKTKGSAKKGSYEQYKYKDGDNKVRLVGGILARYVYWVSIDNNSGGKTSIPMECLAFNRETETFDNVEVDHVQAKFPDLKCQWAYCMLCIDPDDGRVKVLNLKRKLLEQIMVTADDLGDPTDYENGWDVCFKRIKTGPKTFNVEYQLQPLKCKKNPLTPEQIEMVEAKTIDEMVVRPTAEKQLEFLTKQEEKQDEGSDPVDSAVEDEFDIE